MSCESYDLRLTTLSPIHIGSGKSYNCCEFVPAKAKSKGQIVKIIKRVNLTNYYSSLSDDRKDTFLASLTNSNFELKQFDKKIKKDFVRYQCIDNSRVDFINEVQEHIKTSDKLYIPGSSIKGAIRTAIFYDLLTEEDMDKIGRDISSNRRNNSFLSNDLLKKHFTSGFGNDAQYNIFRFMQVADTTTTNLPRIEQVLAVMATDDRRKNQFYSRHGKVVKSYLETIGANKNLFNIIDFIFKDYVGDYEDLEIVFLSENTQEIIRGFNSKYVEKSNIKNFNQKVNKGTFLEKQHFKYLDENIEIPKAKFAKKRDVLVNSLGDGTVGRPHYYNEDTDNVVVDQHITIIRANEDLIPSTYIYEYLKNSTGQYHLDSLISGSTGMLMLNISEIRNLKIPILDKKNLREFDTTVTPLFDKITKNFEEIYCLSKLRDTLLPKLMSGEIDVSKINCDLIIVTFYFYFEILFN